MKKKGLILIFFILFIPLIIIIGFLLNINSLNVYEFDEKKDIVEKPYKIEDYELLLIEQIDSFNHKEPFEYPLEQYDVFPYKIIWKDTLSKIAYRYKLTKDEIKILIYLNKIKDKNLIIANQTLLIPKKKK